MSLIYGELPLFTMVNFVAPESPAAYQAHFGIQNLKSDVDERKRKPVPLLGKHKHKYDFISLDSYTLLCKDGVYINEFLFRSFVE